MERMRDKVAEDQSASGRWLARACLLVLVPCAGCAQGWPTPNAYVKRCHCSCALCHGRLDPITGQCDEALVDEPDGNRYIDICYGESMTPQGVTQTCEEACAAKPDDLEEIPEGSVCVRSGDVEQLYVRSGVELKSCIEDPTHARILVPDPPYVPLTVDPTQSTVYLDADGFKGHTSLSGQLGISGGNCPGRSCDMRLENATMEAPDFDLHKTANPPDIHIRDLFALLISHLRA